jgi:hypothetical protein
LGNEDYSDLIAATKGEDYSDLIAAAGTEEGGPGSFLHPDKFRPSPGRRKFKNQTGPIGHVREQLAEDKANYPTDLASTVDMAAAPFYDAADKATFGAVTGGIKGYGGTTADRYMKAIDRFRGSPVANYTGIAGYMAGGPEMIASGVERAIPHVVNPLAQAARATLGAGVTSGLTSGAEAAGRGEEPMEIAREAGRGYVGGTAVGAPLSAGAALMRGAANTVLNSRGARAREYLDARGQPLAAPDTSDAAIGAAAQRTDEAVKTRMGAYKNEVASRPYMEAINAITPEQAGELVDVAPLYRNLRAAANDPANLQSADKLNTLAGMLEQHRMTLADGSETLLMTQDQINGLRQALGSISGVGKSNAAKLSPLREAFAQAKELVDQGPYAEANRRFARGSEDLNQSLDMVGLRQTTNPDEPIAGNLRVKAQRAGQNTVTAGADTESLDLEAFKAKHPELANDIDAPEIIRRQGDLSFNLAGPSHGGFIERHGVHLSPLVTAMAAAMGHGLEGAAAVPLALALQNRNAIAGRLLYSPAQNSQLAAQLLLGEVPSFGAPGGEVTRQVNDAMRERR